MSSPYIITKMVKNMENLDVLDDKKNHNFSCLHGVCNILVYLESKSILSTTCLHVYYVDYVFLKGDYVFTKQIFFRLQKQKLR